MAPSTQTWRAKQSPPNFSEPLGDTESVVLRGVRGPEVDVGVPGVFVDLFEYQPGEFDSLSCGCHGRVSVGEHEACDVLCGGVDRVFLSRPALRGSSGLVLVLVGEQLPELGEPAGLDVGLDGGGGGRRWGGHSGCGEGDGWIGHGKRRSRTGLARVCGDVQLAGWRVSGGRAPSGWEWNGSYVTANSSSG